MSPTARKLRWSSLFLWQSELQYINRFIGWKSLCEKAIEPQFGQNGYINIEIQEIHLKQDFKLPKQCVQRRDFCDKGRLSCVKKRNFWIVWVTLNSTFQDTPDTKQRSVSNRDL
jgi:hypothetical protein